jgi:hypothetical protein
MQRREGGQKPGGSREARPQALDDGGRGVQPLGTTKRWFVERTNSWTNAHKKLIWCTEREWRVIDFWIALSNAIIIVGRLIREAWTHYRWEGRSARRP